MLEAVRQRWRSDAPPGPVVALAVGLAYFGLAQYVIWLNDPVNQGAGYWPAAGITLAALLLLPAPRWAWVLGGAIVAEIGGGLLHDYPVTASGWWAAGNAIEPLVAAMVLRLVRRSGRLAPIGDLLWFLAAGVVIGPFVGAAIGAIGTVLEFDSSWADVMPKWWAGDGLGVLVVAPLLLSMRERRAPARSNAELLAVASAVVAVPLLAFRGWDETWDPMLPYVLFPLVTVAGVRFGIRGAAIAGFAVAEVANLANALGHGPFALTESHSTTMLQLFLASALSAGLVVATLVQDAVDGTKRFERQRSVADALQTAVLPVRLPDVAGVELAACYEPASEDDSVQIGGDWYDAFELPDGGLALVVGDVAGHDLDAAVVMSQVRNGLRSLLLVNPSPADALAALDQQLAATDQLVTAVVAVYRAGVLEWCNAGHPPLVLVATDGQARFLEAEPQMLLGIGTGTFVARRTPIAPEETVVSFTDGVVEHRTWSLGDAFDHLLVLASAGPSIEPDALCRRLLDGGLGGRAREDDACVLVVRRTPG